MEGRGRGGFFGADAGSRKRGGGVDTRGTKQQKLDNSTNATYTFYAGNSIAGRREAFGTGPEPQNGPETYKTVKKCPPASKMRV